MSDGRPKHALTAIPGTARLALQVVNGTYERLVASQPNERIRLKLGNLHATCRQIVMQQRRALTVPGVVSAYKDGHPDEKVSLAESSIRNARPEGNPYQELYRAWQSASAIILYSRGAHAGGAPNLIGREEVRAIADEQLRHRVSLLLELTIKQQRDIDELRRLDRAPNLRLGRQETTPSTGHRGFVASEAEMLILDSFVDEIQLEARGLRWSASGALETITGRPLSDPGLSQAIKRAILVSKAQR